MNTNRAHAHTHTHTHIKGRICIETKFNLIHQLVTHSLFEKVFVGYELVSFQFLKHDRHAERLCISNLQL
jgi:hypothetical protein